MTNKLLNQLIPGRLYKTTFDDGYFHRPGRGEIRNINITKNSIVLLLYMKDISKQCNVMERYEISFLYGTQICFDIVPTLMLYKYKFEEVF